MSRKPLGLDPMGRTRFSETDMRHLNLERSPIPLNRNVLWAHSPVEAGRGDGARFDSESGEGLRQAVVASAAQRRALRCRTDERLSAADIAAATKQKRSAVDRTAGSAHRRRD